jgi:hypothetical protein
MRCTFCQGNRPAHIIWYAKKRLVCCLFCEILLRSDYPSINLAQCCECGVLINGVFAGLRFVLPNGAPDLSIGHSHGMCVPCKDAKLAEWIIIKQQRAEARLLARTLLTA